MEVEPKHHKPDSVNEISEDLEELRDFSSECSDNFPQILQALNITLAMTSYDSNRLILVRALDGELNTQLEFFPRPMGLHVDQNTLTLGTLTQVINFKRADFFLPKIKDGHYDNLQTFSRKLYEKHPQRAAKYIESRDKKISELKLADAMYAQRAFITTGRINIHDIAWGSDRLWIVNTAFSCLCSLDPEYNFIAHWKPEFISALKPEDRCHLNGMAMLNGMPKYVTTCGQRDIKDDWYERELNGAVIDIETNQVLASGLYMPHSPRVNGDYVYFCESGRACIKRIHRETGNIEVFKPLPGFCRGMCFHGELLFVGLSAMRETERKTYMPIRDFIDPNDTFCGVWLLNANTGELIAELKFTGDVNQIYDIAVINDGHFAAITSGDDVLNQHLYDYVED